MPLSELADQVQDALAHLFDGAYLQTHPLSARLPGGGGARRPGEALRQQLVDVVGSLAPRGGGRAAAKGRRGHSILRLRYLEGLDPTEVRRQLGLSKTLYYLEHNRALEAVASLLESRLRERAAAARAARPAGTPTATPSASAEAPGDRQRPHIVEPGTTFVGRDAELAALRRLLQDSAAGGAGRLLTLTGPAGIGKTRLALRFAADLEAAGDLEVWVIELAGLTAAEELVPAIAQRLGIGERGGGREGAPLTDLVAERLARMPALLVLDNFEQLLYLAADAPTGGASGAAQVAHLVRACRELRVVVTSREALRVYGEWEYPVPPLAVPPRLPATAGSAAPVEAYETVRLFLDRARAVRPDLALDRSTLDAIAETCARLDGLPLAIELAAARCRVLAPSELLARLDRRLDLAGASARDLPSRQQTLRGALDWSHDLLDDAERALFRRLAVFAGGWTVDAVEHVWSALEESRDGLAAPPIDLLDSLVGKSLVRRVEAPGGATRFTMLEFIRDYAGERLDESGERDAAAGAHTAYFLDLTERAAPHLSGAAQAEWLARLDAEYDNLRAAFRRLIASHRAAQAQRLAGALRHFWLVRGRWTEGREWLAAALDAAAPPEHDPNGGADAARASALLAAGQLAALQSDHDAARAAYEESLALAQAIGNAEMEAHAYYGTGNTLLATGRRAGARRALERALSLFRAARHDERTAATLSQLGLVDDMEGDSEAALARHTESAAIRRRLGDKSGLASTLNNLGTVMRGRARFDDAVTFYGEALALCREIGHRLGQATITHNLATVQLQRGAPDAAAPLLLEALALYRELESRRGLAWCLPAAAAIAAARGDDADAAALFGAADVHLAESGAQLDPAERALYDHSRRALRGRLGPDAFETHRRRGEALSSDERFALALRAVS